jgi:hypothetical protein
LTFGLSFTFGTSGAAVLNELSRGVAILHINLGFRNEQRNFKNFQGLIISLRLAGENPRTTIKFVLASSEIFDPNPLNSNVTKPGASRAGCAWCTTKTL